jgi:hypothetical protein
VNPAYEAKCVCGKQVLKIRIGDFWYTMCEVCYRDSYPNLAKMSHGEITACINLLQSLIGESNSLAKKFIDDMRVEEVCRRL